jgi:SAM-dependent methyltransferase
MSDAKQRVSEFWNKASCGEELLLPSVEREGYVQQAQERYRLESFIPGFADFDDSRGLKVLEIGVGLGADHQCFAQAGAHLFGIDLTPRAIEHTTRRLAVFGLKSTLAVGDAESLTFGDNTFDVVYSWGVLHHSPDTPKAFREVLRVLKPGGVARIMIYQKWSIVGLMLWIRYGLLRLRPWTSMSEIYSKHLESPGTKAYTPAEARAKLLVGFTDIHIETVLTHGDLLESGAGQRHQGALLNLARMIWPRRVIRFFAPHRGLFMLIRGRKPS